MAARDEWIGWNGEQRAHLEHVAAAANQMRDAALMFRPQKLVINSPAVVLEPTIVVPAQQRAGLFEASSR